MNPYTALQFRALIDREFQAFAPGVVTGVNVWLARGDGAAVYQNHDFGHPEQGHIKIVSFGLSEAQLPGLVHVAPADPTSGTDVERRERVSRGWHGVGMRTGPVPEDGALHPYGICAVCSLPPERLPDMGDDINWRYVLIGWYRGGPL